MIADASRRALMNTSACVVGGLLQKLCGLWLLRMTVSGMESIHPGMFGQWSVALTLLGYAGGLADFQSDLILLSEFSKGNKPSSRILWNGLLLKLYLATIAFLGMLAILPHTPYPSELKVTVLYGSFALFSGCIGVFRVYCQSRLESLFINFVQLGCSILLIGGFSLLISHQASLLHFALMQVFTTITGDILIAIHVMRKISLDFTLDFSLIRSVLTQTLTPGFCSFLTILAYRYDVVLLSIYRSSREVGLYAASFRLTEAFSFVPGAVIRSIYPLLCRIKNPSDAYPILLRWMMIPGVGVLTLFLACGDSILVLMYGDCMREAVAVIRWLGVSECIMFLSPLPFFILLASGKRREFFLSVCAFTFVNVLSNSLLTARYGIVWAAICTTLTELTAFIFGTVQLHKSSKFGFPKRTAPLILGSITTFASMKYLEPLPPWLSILLCVGIYTSVLLLLKGINREDVRLLRSALLRDGSGTVG